MKITSRFNFTRQLVMLSLSLLVLIPAIAQNKFQPGYIIQPGGDTVRGWINNENWEKKADQVFFKDEKGSINKYSPKSIRGFGSENRVFVSANILNEITNTNINNLDYTEKLQLVADTVFLEAIITGPKSLYYYHNSIGKEQYYINQEGNFEFLKHKKFLKLIDEKSIQFEDRTYMNQIVNYLDNCPEVSLKINETAYTYKKLEDIFQVYYTCKGSIALFQKKKVKAKLYFGALAGVTQTNLKFKSPYFSYLVNGKSSPSRDFTAGGFFEVGLGRTKKNLFLNNELLFTQYSFDIHHEDYVDANNYTNTHSTLGYSYLRFNNMVRYKVYLPTLTLFANFGISNSFSLSKTNERTTEKKFFTSETNENGKALDDVRSIESGWNVGGGAMFKKIMLQFRFESTNGMSTYDVLNSRLHKTYILFGYQF